MLNRLVKAMFPEYSNEQFTNSRYVFSPKFFLHIAWLLSCTFLIYYFEIEKNKGFDKVAALISAAFLVYVIIPLRHRKLFLVVLAFIIETYLLGYKLSIGVLLFILYFVGLTYIPQKLIRNSIVLISVFVCVLITSKVVIIPFARLVVMFGALFLMLRYIYFLYELNYMKVPPVFIDRLCYLFLIPNACFPLFPVLSPIEYSKSYYDQAAAVSFQKGLNWITIGIVHLLIYRVIYMYFSPSPYEIDGFNKWMVFILSAYSLIFRLSGLFYLGMGFFQLFGFRLSPIFDHVYFASSFPDLWRRVNLYWRAFMMRVFYYPFVFKLKKLNPKLVLFIATITMFGCTWLLHSWQWFWIKGSYYFYATDMLFWFTLGMLISTSAVITYNKLNQQQTKPSEENHFIVVAKIVFMFFVMSCLWSLWTASSLSEFVYIAKFVSKGGLNDYLNFIGIVLGVIVLAGCIRWLYKTRGYFSFVFKEFTWYSAIVLFFVLVVSLELLKQNNYQEQVESFVSMNINSRDKSLLERGYYEQILNNDDKSIELFNIGNKFKKWNLDRDAYKKTSNELLKEFIPNFKINFKGDTLSTNSFGLRDKEYSLVKNKRCVRLAFVGGSYVMGSGVSNEANFASVLETELQNVDKDSVEIFNFGVGGYYFIQNVYVVKNKISLYKPDYLFCFIHSSYRNRCLDNFANLLQKQTSITFPYLKDIAQRAGIEKGMCHLEIYNRLKPFIDDVFDWGYKSMIEECKQNEIKPVLVYLPSNASLKADEDKDFCIQHAREAGFYIIDLSGVYKGHKPGEIQLSAWDTHPNGKGHRLISEKLMEAIRKDNHFFTFIK